MRRLIGFASILALGWAPAAFAQTAVVIPGQSTSGTVTATTCDDSLVTSQAGCVVMALHGQSAVSVQATGTWTATLVVEGSNNPGTWVTLGIAAADGSGTVTSFTADGAYQVGATFKYVRVRASAYTNGTAVVNIVSAAGGGGSGSGGSASSVTINDPSVTTQKAAVNASGQLSVTCANCSGSGASAVDEAAFTVGVNSGAPAMGIFETSPSTLTTGHAGLFEMTSDRALFTNLYKVGGTAVATGTGVGTAGALRVQAATDDPIWSRILSSTFATGSAGAAATTGFISGGIFHTTQPTITDGNEGELQLTNRGGLIVGTGADTFHVTCDSGCSGSGGTSSTFGSTFPAAGTATGYSDGTNMQGARVFDADSGVGTQYVLGANLRASASGGSVELFPAPAALGDGTSNPTTTSIASMNMCFNGTTWDRCKSATLGNGTNANAQLVTIASDSTGQVKTTNLPTTVTLNAGAADASTIRVVNDPLWGGATAKGVSSAITTTTSTQVVAAVASNYLYITSCQVTQSSTTVGTAVNLQDGSGGTTLATIPAPAAANSVGVSGSSIPFPTPLKVTTLGNGLFAAAVTTGSNLVVSCQGFSSTVSR